MRVWTDNELKALGANLTLGRGVLVEAERLHLGRDVVLGDGVVIRGEKVTLGDGAQIQAESQLAARTLRLGAGVRVEMRCTVGALGEIAEYIEFGDQALLAHDCKMLVPVGIVGDYASIHNHTTINGFAPMLLGHNSWVGQNCMLNANKRLSIGNHVGIGAYSSIYTHGFFGDVLEGCQVHKEAPVTLEDDAWILGAYNIISPGVTVGQKGLVLTGSNVVRDVPANHTVGGAPARDMTDRLVPFTTRTPGEKLTLMCGFIDEFVQTLYPQDHRKLDDGYRLQTPYGSVRVACVSSWVDYAPRGEFDHALVLVAAPLGEVHAADQTVFSLVDRTYTKTGHPCEVQLIRFLRNPKARFVPRDRPRLQWPLE
jgi:acetyltransferase-like isoleucine patch superfamily enzyme